MTITDRLSIEEQYGYIVEANGEIKAPCRCSACNGGVQAGHFACSTPPPVLLEAEERGEVTRRPDGGTWRWFTVPPSWRRKG